MVMKGQVAHWSGFQEEVGSVMTGTDTAGLTMLTGSTGTGREMSPPPLRADTEDWHSWLDTYTSCDPVPSTEFCQVGA